MNKTQFVCFCLAVVGISAFILNNPWSRYNQEHRSQAARDRSESIAAAAALEYRLTSEDSKQDPNDEVVLPIVEQLAPKIVMHPALLKPQTTSETRIESLIKRDPAEGIKELGLLLEKTRKLVGESKDITIHIAPDTGEIVASFKPHNMAKATFVITRGVTGTVSVRIRSTVEYGLMYPSPGVSKDYEQGSQIEALIGPDGTVAGLDIDVGRTTYRPDDRPDKLRKSISQRVADLEKVCIYAQWQALDALAKKEGQRSDPSK